MTALRLAEPVTFPAISGFLSKYHIIYHEKGEKRMKLTPMKRIRLKCLDCACSRKEVRLCPATDCVLWPVRFGKRPKVDSEPEKGGLARDYSSGMEKTA